MNVRFEGEPNLADQLKALYAIKNKDIRHIPQKRSPLRWRRVRAVIRQRFGRRSDTKEELHQIA